MNIEKEDDRRSVIDNLLCIISEKNDQHNIDASAFEVFKMRSTRNKVANVIKKALKNKNGSIFENNYCDTIVHIRIY